jgi:L-threonylcarbamoyladenylate synthase
MRTQVFTVDAQHPDPAVMQAAGEIIRAGGLVAFPTETVYGLGADATSGQAVARIFAAKARPATDPIIVHIAGIDALGCVAVAAPPLAEELARQFWPGPLTLVLRRADGIPANVAAGGPTVAVRMPAHPVALALIAAAGVPIAAPSANTFSRPSATTAAHVLEDLDGRIDAVIDAGPAPIGVESTIVDLTSEPPAVLRPGGVPVEALRVLIPKLVVRQRFGDIDTPAEAPGQLIRHYSPRARMLLYRDADALPVMLEQARARLAHGERIGAALPESELAAFAALGVVTASLGPTLETAAQRLFAALRELDRLGVQAIYTHGLKRSGLGAALWDRMLRAAEGVVQGPAALPPS